MEELSIILESKQSELDQKDELVKKVGEFNDTVDKLKVELSETKEERDRLEERIEELEGNRRNIDIFRLICIFISTVEIVSHLQIW